MTDSNGLYYMRARYYNPDIKRFINQDIKVGDISNGQGLNRYAYPSLSRVEVLIILRLEDIMVMVRVSGVKK